MRRLSVLLVFLLLLSACENGCASKRTGSAQNESSDEASGDRTKEDVVADALQNSRPRFGGVVFEGQDYAVELMPHWNGLIEASIRTARGAEVEGGARMTVSYPADSGGRASAELRWDADKLRYMARTGADRRPVTGRFEIELAAGGETTSMTKHEVPVAPAPRIGGVMLLAGSYAAEVRAEEEGRLHARVLQAEGETVPSGEDISVTVSVHGTDGRVHPLGLSWNRQRNVFSGTLDDELRVSPGPVVFVLVQGDETHHGRVKRVAPAREPRHEGRVLVAADHTVELVKEDRSTIRAYLADAHGEPASNAELRLFVRPEASADGAAMSYRADGGYYAAGADAGGPVAGGPVRVAVVARGGVRYAGIAGVSNRDPGRRGSSERRSEGRVRAGDERAARDRDAGNSPAARAGDGGTRAQDGADAAAPRAPEPTPSEGSSVADAG
jgi:hypothetical protein